jgi:hypothetical protein
MVIKSPQLKLKFHPNDAILSISNNDATGFGVLQYWWISRGSSCVTKIEIPLEAFCDQLVVTGRVGKCSHEKHHPTIGDTISNRYLTEGDVQNPPPKKGHLLPLYEQPWGFPAFFSTMMVCRQVFRPAYEGWMVQMVNGAVPQLMLAKYG